ncbi:hypothetical protein C0995_015896 [Termitomyces sp. Mi166|nr:hypothetical protein C0995_015896 [Termitomyces sp. Mi166\
MSQHNIKTTWQEIERLTRTNVVTSTTITQLWNLIVAIMLVLLILTQYYYDSVMDYIIKIHNHINILESIDPSDTATGTDHPTATSIPSSAQNAMLKGIAPMHATPKTLLWLEDI